MADDGVFSWLPEEFLDDTLFQNYDLNSSTEPATQAESSDEKEDEPKLGASSTQSTLCPLEGWPTPSERSRCRSGDPLHVMAGQGISSTPENSFPTSVPNLQRLQFERLRQEQLIKQQISVARANLKGASFLAPLQQQRHQNQPRPGSGMRAVFLNSARPGKVSNGTGVFIPRSAEIAGETRTKPACATVLIPARVAQALNLNLDELNASSRTARFPGLFILNHDADVAGGITVWQKQKHRRREPAATSTRSVQLPLEWAY